MQNCIFFISLKPGEIEIANADPERMDRNGRIMQIDVLGIHAHHDHGMGEVLACPLGQLASLDRCNTWVLVTQVLVQNLQRAVPERHMNAVAGQAANIGKWRANCSQIELANDPGIVGLAAKIGQGHQRAGNQALAVALLRDKWHGKDNARETGAHDRLLVPKRYSGRSSPLAAGGTSVRRANGGRVSVIVLARCLISATWAS